MLLGCTLIFSCGCREQILHNLSESEVNHISTGLQSIGVYAARDRQPDGRWLIAVQSGETNAALKYIEAHRLLRSDRPVPVENSSLLVNRDQQRFDLERKLSGEIESTLSMIDGVLEARVHLNLPEVDPLFGQPSMNDKGSASVLLITAREFSSPSADIAAIVAGASGVAREAVAVLISKGAEESSNVAAGALQIRATTAAVSISDEAAGISHSSFYSVFENTWILELASSFMIIGVGLLCISRARRPRLPLPITHSFSR